MNAYLPHIIGIVFLLGGFIVGMLQDRNKNSETGNTIQSSWIANHAYKAD